MKYVAGWIVKKTKVRHERERKREDKKREKLGLPPSEPKEEQYLGKKTSEKSGDTEIQYEFDAEEERMAPWIFALSKGGLYVPSTEFSKDVEQFEEEFLRFHGKSGLRRENMIIERFTEILERKFGEKYERALLALFSKTRTHFEIKHLIKKMALEKAEKDAKNAAKRKENEQKRFTAAVEKAAEKLAEKRPFQSDLNPLEPQPKKLKINPVKNVRDYVKLGHNST